jgi:hypothetical protein
VKFSPEEPFPTSFKATPNSAIYLGDFSGYAKFNMHVTVATFETGLTEVDNNFFETTRAFREKFPNLASIPVRSTLDSTTKQE